MKFTRLHLDRDCFQVDSLHDGLNLVFCPIADGITAALRQVFRPSSQRGGRPLSGWAELTGVGGVCQVSWTDDGASPRVQGDDHGSHAAVTRWMESIGRSGLDALLAVDFHDPAALDVVVRSFLNRRAPSARRTPCGGPSNEQYPWREEPDVQVEWDSHPGLRAPQERDLHAARRQLQQALNALHDVEMHRVGQPPGDSLTEHQRRRAAEIRGWLNSTRRELSSLEAEIAAKEGNTGIETSSLGHEQLRSLHAQIDRVHRVRHDVEQRLLQLQHRLNDAPRLDPLAQNGDSLREAYSALEVEIQRVARASASQSDNDVDHVGFEYESENHSEVAQPWRSRTRALLEAARRMHQVVAGQAEALKRRDLLAEARQLRKCLSSLRHRLKRLTSRRLQAESALETSSPNWNDEASLLRRRREECLARLRRWEKELSRVEHAPGAFASPEVELNRAHWEIEVDRLEQLVDRLAAELHQGVAASGRVDIGVESVLARAGQLLRKMTDGLYGDVWQDAGFGALRVSAPGGRRVLLSETSPSTSRSVLLSIVLAMHEQFRGEHATPIVLDRLVGGVERGQLPQVLRTLGEYGRSGSQLIVTVERLEDVHRCEDLGLPVNRPAHRAPRPAWTRSHCEARSEAPRSRFGGVGGSSDESYPLNSERAGVPRPLFTDVTPEVSRTIYDWPEGGASQTGRSAATEFVNEATTHNSTARDATTRSPGPLPSGPRSSAHRSPENGWSPLADRDGRFPLDFLDLVSRVPFLSSPSARALEAAGAWTVADFIRADAEELRRRMSEPISAGELRIWQAQALLMCSVARLSAFDARILVACGVTDPVQLQNMDPLELARRVERFSQTPQGRRVLEDGSPFELARIRRWIESAHRGQPLADFDDATRHRPSQPPSRRRASEPSSANADRRADTTDEAAGEARSTRKRRRIIRRTTRAGDQASAAPPPSGAQKTRRIRELRFYLDPTSKVEAGPSIGAKTAERLCALGIHTVGNLLEANVDELARQLGRRFTAKMVAEWQQQAALVCQVPELRGHDAQLLVACGVTEASQLAHQDVDQLFASVHSLIDTKAGSRILRNGPRPKREDVASWVQWAKQHRKLRAA